MSERHTSGLDRLDAARVILPYLDDAAVVTSLGISSWTMFSAADRDLTFYTQGSMGLASSIGLGLASALPERRVVSMEGEGSLLMNLGILTTVATAAPSNLTMLIWDDCLYSTTGGQPSHTADGIDLVAVARACGLSAVRVSEPKSLAEQMSNCVEATEPTLILVETRPLDRTLDRNKVPPLVIKHRLMAALNTCRCHGGVTSTSTEKSA